MKNFYQYLSVFCLGGSFVYPFCGGFAQSLVMLGLALLSFLLSKAFK